MFNNNWQAFGRFGLALLVLSSGLLFLPLSGLSAEKLRWNLYAGIYEPSLDVLTANEGAPGSSFLFEATGYPSNSQARIFVNGRVRGMLMTDGSGRAQFLIRSRSSDLFGRYFVTMSTDANTTDTDEIRLENGVPVIPRPQGWNGPTFQLFRNLPEFIYL